MTDYSYAPNYMGDPNAQPPTPGNPSPELVRALAHILASPLGRSSAARFQGHVYSRDQERRRKAPPPPLDVDGVPVYPLPQFVPAPSREAFERPSDEWAFLPPSPDGVMAAGWYHADYPGAAGEAVRDTLAREGLAAGAPFAADEIVGMRTRQGKLQGNEADVLKAIEKVKRANSTADALARLAPQLNEAAANEGTIAVF